MHEILVAFRATIFSSAPENFRVIKKALPRSAAFRLLPGMAAFLLSCIFSSQTAFY